MVNDEVPHAGSRVDLIEHPIDVALRVRVKLDTDPALTMRTLGISRRILVASPALANRLRPQLRVSRLSAW
jgi:DNA-binding transcriptional LysR family regulator